MYINIVKILDTVKHRIKSSIDKNIIHMSITDSIAYSIQEHLQISGII